MKISRRQFLRGAGGAMLALPFLPSLARAETTAYPKRIIFLYMPQNETSGFLPENTGRDFTLNGTYLEPLEPWKSRLIVGLKLKGRSGHQGGHAETLSGWTAMDGVTPDQETWRPRQGPSIDQLIAKRLQGKTPLSWLGLTLAAQDQASRNDGTVSWSEDALSVPAIAYPRAGFERVFGPVGGGSSTPSPDVAEAARTRQLKTSLLDRLLEDFHRVNQRLSAEDRRLLDAHTTLLREQEQLLQAEPVVFSCDGGGGTPPPATNDPDYAEGDWPERARLHVDTIVAAVRCDALRVANISFGIAQNSHYHSWLGVTEDFHQIAHESVAGENWEKHFTVRKWYAEQVARLARGLDSIPEGTGTALDNTAIVWHSELGTRTPENDPTGQAHLRTEVGTVIVGGCGGFFNTGQVVDFQGRDYCDLLLTFAHAMGYTDVTSFGASSTGPLEAIMA